VQPYIFKKCVESGYPYVSQLMQEEQCPNLWCKSLSSGSKCHIVMS